MKPPIEYRPRPGKAKKKSKPDSPVTASDGGGVQFPLADRAQVSNEVQLLSSAEAEGQSPDSAGGSDSPERRAPTQAEIDALLEEFRATERAKVLARVHRHRAKKSNEAGPV